MPAVAVVGIAEGLVGLVELLILLIQLMIAVLELVFHAFAFLAELLVSRFTKEPDTSRPALTARVRATLEKRFGGHEDAASEAVNQKTKIWNPYSPEPTPPFKWERRHTVALLIWAAVIAVIVIVVGMVWGRRFDLTVTQAELQQAVSGAFPKSKTLFRVVDTTVHSPVVKLNELADKLSITLECAVKVHGVPGAAKGTLTASGRLEYRAQNGAFYLTEVVVDRIDLVGVPDRWEAKANDAVGTLAREVLDIVPVYRLKDDRWKDQAAKLLLRRVRVENGALVLTMRVG